jgi:ketosteroid isomerase-like protein
MFDRDQRVRSFWQAFDTADLDAAAKMMAPDAVVTWPCTNEVFRGRDNFIAVQKHYPGRWRIAVEKVVVAVESVITVVKVTPEGSSKPSFHATSFFEFDEAGQISAITEYWATDEDSPEWRKAGGWAGHQETNR